MVDKPTGGNNILNIVCISDPSCTDKLEVEESFALSDHKSIKILLLLRYPVVRITSQSIKIYLYSKGNYEAINKEIKNTDWSKEYNNKSTIEMWEPGLAFFQEERYFFPSVGRNMGKKGRNTFLPGRNGRN